MDSSNSNSSDGPSLHAETLSFDESTFPVLPVIVDGQISLTDLERDVLDTESLLSVHSFCPAVITLSDGSNTILEDPLDSSGSILVEDCTISPGILDCEELDQEEVTVSRASEVEEGGDGEEGVETVNVPVTLIAEETPGDVYEARVVQLDGGTLAYVYTHPQDGSQAVELEDGSCVYFSLAQPPRTEDPLKAPEPLKKQRSFMCPQEGCGRLYTSSHHLKVHERTHTGSRPYNCTVEGCNKAFSTDYSRKAHIRTHTGEKPYKCMENFCTKSFKTSGDLQKHIRTHTGERPFTCPVEGCHRAFTTSNIRKVHIRTHTGERPYVCNEPFCEKAFSSATNYKNHIRIHSGEKPYVCNVEGCNKRFTEYSSLYKHHMVHTQEKPYQCGVCGRSYRQASTLTVHKRTAHGVIEASDGTEIVLGNVNMFTEALKGGVSKVKTVGSSLLNEGEYVHVMDSTGAIQRLSSEQIFIIDDTTEQLNALQHIQDPDEEELKAALDPLQDQ